MKTQYEVNGLHKMAEEDTFNEGANPDTANCDFIKGRFEAPTIKELIEKIGDSIGLYDGKELKDSYELDSCEEAGRIDFQLMEKAGGNTPSKNELSLWKKGKLKLWAVTYSAYVERVTRETVSLKKIK